MKQKDLNNQEVGAKLRDFAKAQGTPPADAETPDIEQEGPAPEIDPNVFPKLINTTLANKLFKGDLPAVENTDIGNTVKQELDIRFPAINDKLNIPEIPLLLSCIQLGALWIEQNKKAGQEGFTVEGAH